MRIFCCLSVFRSPKYVLRFLVMASIFLLFAQNMSKLIRFISSSRISGTADHIHDVSSVRESVIHAFASPLTTDSSGEYRIVKWPVRPTPVSARDTTLISQCSESHLHQLIDLQSAWDGSISVAVFIESSGTLLHVVNYLIKMQLCLSQALSSMSIQLVMPLSSSIYCCAVMPNISCVNSLSELKKPIEKIKNYDTMVDYPNNLLRNVAIHAAVTDYIFVVDIDMLPSSNLFSQFQDFTHRLRSSDKIAYVVPVFEMEPSVKMPANRPALLQMWDHGVIQTFYKNLCWKCQRYTDYDMWRNLTVNLAEQLNIAYTVKWHDPWEPFYLIHREAPKYNEKFKNYGFNRISQSCELNVAGYQFAVLDIAFLIHQGFKSVDQFHSHKDIDLNKNRMLFRTFKKTLKIRYPSSTLRC